MKGKYYTMNICLNDAQVDMLRDFVVINHFKYHSYAYDFDKSCYKKGEMIWLGADAVVSEYTMFRNTFCSMSAFSYMATSGLGGAAHIGRCTSIATNAHVFQGDHDSERFTQSEFGYLAPTFDMFSRLLTDEEKRFKPVIRDFKRFCDPTIYIGSDVWIGADVAIKRGVTIGDGAVVGTGAIVTKDIPPYEIWAGVPAHKIKDRFPDEIKKQLLEIKWWDYDWRQFDARADMTAEQFIRWFGDNKKYLKLYTPRTFTGKDFQNA